MQYLVSLIALNWIFVVDCKLPESRLSSVGQLDTLLRTHARDVRELEYNHSLTQLYDNGNYRKPDIFDFGYQYKENDTEVVMSSDKLMFIPRTFDINKFRGYTVGNSSDKARARSRRDAVPLVEGPSYRCGGWLNNTRGVITTPNFPQRFPVPIRCQWMLFAPPGKKIMLYFTQFYLREALRVTEYDLYANEDFYVGKEDLGEMSFEALSALMGLKPYMVLTFDVHELGNIHLRVKNFLLDVYGFNITYEIIDEKEQYKEQTCSVAECSFLGNCIASHDYKYQCECFGDYYGDECQYGLFCDPELQINRCKNNGKCRYYYGSMVNTCECPPNYDGPQCEIRREDYVDSECAELNCSQMCAQNEYNKYFCTCREGYKLADDEKTCLAEGRMRYHIGIRLKTAGNNVSFSCNEEYILQDALFEVIKSVLTDVTYTNVTLLGHSRMDEYIYIDFYFMGLKANKDDIWLIMQSMVYKTTLCSLTMDSQYLVFDAHPAPLHLITLGNYDNQPSIEGHLLTMYCKAKGSSHLTFSWYKDNYYIDVHKTDRNMWLSEIPTYDGETHISVLNIEKAHYLDKGEFTCVASDWGDIDAKSLHGIVIPRPHMEVSPLAITTPLGTDTAIDCLSRDDDKTALFEYWWERDGQPLVHDQNEEIVEQMLPIGSRLKLTARVPAQYTCIVQSQAGQTRETSILNILPEEHSKKMVCFGEVYREVVWQTTLSDRVDIQHCPRSSEGKAKRRCKCLDSHCIWDEPDFSTCKSIHLDSIAQNFQKLKLGYQTSNVTSHLLLLHEYLKYDMNNRTFFMSGDIKTSSSLLLDIQQYVHHFVDPDDKKSMYENIFATLDIILDLCLRVTAEEIKELSVTSFIMKLIENIRRDLIVLSGSFQYLSRHLNIEIVEDPHCVEHTYTLYQTLQVHIWIETTAQLCDAALHRLVVNYQQLGPILDIRMPEYYPNGDLVYVGLESRDYDVRGLQVYIQQQNRVTLEHTQVNTTLCTMWEHGSFENSDWTTNGCEVLQRHPTNTTCKCILPGHFMVFSQAEQQESVVSVLATNSMHLIILICLIIGLCGFCLSLCSQIITWRYSTAEPRIIAISFVLSMIGICSLLLRGISNHDGKVICLVLKLMLYFFILAAFCSSVAEAVHLYMKSLGESVQYVYTKPLSIFTDIFISIGIPLIALVPILTLGEINGYNEHNGFICWIVADDWEFYGLIIPAGVLFMVFVVLVSLAISNNSRKQMLPKPKRMPGFKFYIFRCSMRETLLCGVFISMFLFNQYNVVLHEWLLGSFIISLAIFNAVTVSPKAMLKYTRKYFPETELPPCSVCNIQGTTFCSSDCPGSCLSLPGMKSRVSHASQSSFKVFVRPQYSIESGGTFRGDVGEALDRDKARYTKEKKEQLVALLGQSNGSDGSRETDGSQVTDTSFSASQDNELDDTIDEEIGYSRRSTNITFLMRNKSRSRHNANSLCACSKCGTSFPFRPARGRSLITVNDDMKDSLKKTASYCETNHKFEPEGPVRRQSMPNPFPELSTAKVHGNRAHSVDGDSCEVTLSRTTSPKKRRSSNNSRVKFQIGEAEYSASDHVNRTGVMNLSDTEHIKFRSAETDDDDVFDNS